MKILSRRYIKGFRNEKHIIQKPCIIVETDIGTIVIESPTKAYLVFPRENELNEIFTIVEDGESYLILLGRKYRMEDVVNSKVDMSNIHSPKIDWVKYQDKELQKNS